MMICEVGSWTQVPNKLLYSRSSQTDAIACCFYNWISSASMWAMQKLFFLRNFIWCTVFSVTIQIFNNLRSFALMQEDTHNKKSIAKNRRRKTFSVCAYVFFLYYFYRCMSTNFSDNTENQCMSNFYRQEIFYNRSHVNFIKIGSVLFKLNVRKNYDCMNIDRFELVYSIFIFAVAILNCFYLKRT